MLPDSIKELVRPFYLKWLYFQLRPKAKPAEWNACWNYAAAGTASLPPSPGAPDILFLPMTDWHARIQRPYHLARAMARRGHRCFYLNPHLGREFPNPVRLDRGAKACRLEEGVYELHIGLVREPVFHHRMLSNEESEEVATALHSMLPQGPLVVITQFPLWNKVLARLRLLRPSFAVYDCHDLLSGFSRISPEILAAETALYQQVDVVVFTARTLLEEKLKEMPWLGEKAHIVRNGVDTSHFQLVPGGKRRVVGYAGSLDEWFDVEAVRHAAIRFPECEFVLLGRVEDRKVLTLGLLPNVRFFGEIPYDQLPGYIKEFDVALIPFLITPLTLATNPIKLYEYFSCGLPVVSTHLPEVMRYDELVHLAATPDEFADQVGRALDETGDALKRKRRAVAESQSWDARAGELSGLLPERIPFLPAGS